MTDKLKCDFCEATGDIAFYEWPVQDETTGKGITACNQHAAENGFCSMCGHFVLGISIEDELTIERLGVCADCLEELMHETGEYDDQYDDDNDFDMWDYDTWEDIYTGESGGRYIGPGSDTAPEDS